MQGQAFIIVFGLQTQIRSMHVVQNLFDGGAQTQTQNPSWQLFNSLNPILNQLSPIRLLLRIHFQPTVLAQIHQSTF